MLTGRNGPLESQALDVHTCCIQQAGNGKPTKRVASPHRFFSKARFERLIVAINSRNLLAGNARFAMGFAFTARCPEELIATKIVALNVAARDVWCKAVRQPVEMGLKAKSKMTSNLLPSIFTIIDGKPIRVKRKILAKSQNFGTNNV